MKLDQGFYFKMYSSAVAIPDKKVLLIGGGGFANEISCFDLITSKISLKCLMLKSRTEHASVYAKGKVYIIGGYDKSLTSYLTDCEVLDITQNTTNLIAPM